METRADIRRKTIERTARGERHYAWKGGTKKAKHGDRGTPEYAAWRKAVFERDGYTCFICTEYHGGGDLEAHHIKAYATHPELRFEVENGITLCHYHHQHEVHDHDPSASRHASASDDHRGHRAPMEDFCSPTDCLPRPDLGRP